jgi:hypothetical protein
MYTLAGNLATRRTHLACRKSFCADTIQTLISRLKVFANANGAQEEPEKDAKTPPPAGPGGVDGDAAEPPSTVSDIQTLRGGVGGGSGGSSPKVLSENKMK